MNRRDFLVGGGTVAATLGLGLAPARATPAEAQEAIRKLTGSAPINQGRVTLELPPLVENGNSVPLKIGVESPMTRDGHVKAIHVFAEKNPQPYVALFRFGPRAGRASVSGRSVYGHPQVISERERPETPCR
jgi:sulfur-oxidizing protein SoxY